MSKKTEALEVILGLMPNAKFIDKNGKDVTEDVKKSHNKQTLTEQWKKGELEQGWYYVKNEFGNIFISEYSKDYDFIGERVISGFFTEVSEIIEIICEVPSYEEWQPFTDPYFRGLTTKDIAELAKKSIRLTKQHCEDNERIEKLEELLKECRDGLEKIKHIGETKKLGAVYQVAERTLARIDEALK